MRVLEHKLANLRGAVFLTAGEMMPCSSISCIFQEYDRPTQRPHVNLIDFSRLQERKHFSFFPLYNFTYTGVSVLDLLARLCASNFCRLRALDSS